MTSSPPASDDPAAEPSATSTEAPAPIRGTTLGRLVGGSAVSLVGFCVTVLQAVLQVPLLLEVWPAETFTAWVTALAMHAFVISCDVGFHSFIGVEIILTGLGRRAAIRGLFNDALRVWAVLSVVQLAIVAAVWFGPRLLPGVDAQTIQLLGAARVPFAILVVQWIVVGSLLSLVCRVLLAGGQTIFFQWFGVMHRTMLFVATVVAAWAGRGVGGVALAYSVAGTVFAVIGIVYVLRRYPLIVPHRADGSWRTAWSLFRRSSGLTVSSMLEQSAVGGLTTVVAGVFHDLQTAAFATMRSLANFVTQAAGVLLNPAVPEFGRAATPAGVHKAALIIDSAFIIGTTMLAAAVSISSPWARTLYAAWTRHELPFDASLFIGLVAGVLIRQVGLPLHYFLLGTNRVRPQFVATAIRATVVYGSLPFAIAWLGLTGVSVSIVAAEGCTAAYLTAVMRQAFRDYGRAFQPQGPLLAAAQAIVAVACLGGVLATPASPSVFVGAALAAHAMLLMLQIRTVPAELISRAVRHMTLGLRESCGGAGRA
jgi:hypothetical protein